MYQDFLLTTAQISGALLGFVGVVLILGRRSEGVLSKRDESGLFHLIFTSTGALFFSLIMYAFLASFEQHEIIWRIGSGLHVLYSSFGPAKATIEGRKEQNRLGPLARFLLTCISIMIVVLNLLVVFGFITTLAPLIYMLSVILLLGVSIAYFIPLVYFQAEE